MMDDNDDIDLNCWIGLQRGMGIIKSLEEANAKLRRFIQRVDRGDPRICKPGYENSKYFEKFGYGE